MTPTIQDSHVSDEPLVPEDAGDEPLLTAKKVRALLGGISEMTMWRWRRDKFFPAPDYEVHGRNLWRPSTIRSFLEKNSHRGGASA